MNDEEYRDYRDISPDPKNRDGFQYFTERLIDTIRKTPAPTEFQKGTRTAINEEFRRLNDILRKLSPEANAELRRREVEYIAKKSRKPVTFKTNPVDADIKDQYAMMMYLGGDSSAARLSWFTEEPYQGRRVDAREIELVREAKALWIEFGGIVTVSEQISGFYDYMERLVGDADLKITARTLLRNYA